VVEEKLEPSYEQLYPGKVMVLLLDSAPYYHKRKGRINEQHNKETVC
jgi:hypothetical protein